MNLRKLSNENLLFETKRLVQKERECITQVLWHLREVEARKLFVDLGFTSLFEYTVKELRYSESSAMRRINAMRILKDLPQVEESLKEGTLSLSQLCAVQSFLKAERKEEGWTYSPEEKLELITSIQGKSLRETEKVFLTLAPASFIKSQERIKAVSDTTTKIETYLDKRVLDKLERVRELASHKVKSNSISELIEYLADEVIEKHEKKEKTFTQKTGVKRTAPSTSQVNSESTSRYIPVVIKQELAARSKKQCEFVDSKSKKRCQCRRYLEIDHIKPYALGGKSSIENLRVLCRSHNRWRAAQTFGLRG